MAFQKGIIVTAIAVGIAFTLSVPLTASAQGGGGQQPAAGQGGRGGGQQPAAPAQGARGGGGGGGGQQEAAVAAVVAALKLTLPRQAPETFARFFLTGAGIWACCAAIRKSI